MITEIIFRIIIEHFYCVYYLLGLFFMRNASIRKKVLALAGYEFIVFLLFFGYLLYA